jgi:hypothetical protein
VGEACARLPRNVDVDADIIENFERNGGSPAIRARMPSGDPVGQRLSHTHIPLPYTWAMPCTWVMLMQTLPMTSSFSIAPWSDHRVRRQSFLLRCSMFIIVSFSGSAIQRFNGSMARRFNSSTLILLCSALLTLPASTFTFYSVLRCSNFKELVKYPRVKW